MITQSILWHVPEVENAPGVPHFSTLRPKPRMHPGLCAATPSHPFPKPDVPLLFAVHEDSLCIAEEILEPRRREISGILVIRN
jgi:hypothetical protein